MGRYYFITVDGVDGTGKTTVSKGVADILGADYISTPPSFIRSIRSHIDSEGSVQTRFLYYLMSVSGASDYVRARRGTRHIVCDRYVYSTLAYHRALGFDGRKLISYLELEAPDFSFHLTVSDERLRQRRIADRKNKTLSDMLVDNIEVRTQIIEAFGEMGLTEIDTTSMSASDTAARMLDLIRECGREVDGAGWVGRTISGS